MKKQVLLNAFAQGLGKAITAITSFIIVKIITSISTELYGQYLTAYEYLAFFGIIADSGLFAIAIREMTKKPENTEHIMGNILSMRLILITVITAIAGITAQFIGSYPDIVQTGIWITGLSMALTIVAGTLASVLQARMKIYWFTGALVLGKILLAGIIFWLFKHPEILQDSLYPLLWAGVASNILFCVLVIIFARREVRLTLGTDFAWWKHIFKIAIPYGVALILQTLYLRIDVVLISIMLGMRDTALYGGATRVLESFLVLGTFFGQAFLPEVSRNNTSNDSIGKSLSWAIIMVSILALPVIIGISAFSTDIVLLLATPDLITNATQTGSDTIMLVLIGTVLFAYLNQLFTFTLVSQNRQNYLLFVNAFALGLNAGLNILFLKEYGIIAAAWSTIICEIIVCGFLIREIKDKFNLSFNTKNILILFSANTLLFSMVYLTPLKNTFILAAVLGSISYGTIILLFRKSLMNS